jgi:hypothetical protein
LDIAIVNFYINIVYVMFYESGLSGGGIGPTEPENRSLVTNECKSVILNSAEAPEVNDIVYSKRIRYNASEFQFVGLFVTRAGVRIVLFPFVYVIVVPTVEIGVKVDPRLV